MKHYRFEFREGFAEEILEGVELDDDESARKEAVRVARELMATGVLAGLDRSGWSARVYNEAGEVITTLLFSDLLEKRGALE